MNREIIWGIIRVTRLLAWRSLQALLILPSVIVGTYVLTLALSGESPAQSALEALYEYADESIRPAPPGFVVQQRCIEPDQVSGNKPLSFICASQESYLVPADEFISDSVEVLFRMYLILATASVAFLIAAFPLSFSGLRKASQAPHDAKDHKP
jgi:hypothetical protein